MMFVYSCMESDCSNGVSDDPTVLVTSLFNKCPINICLVKFVCYLQTLLYILCLSMGICRQFI